MKVVYYILLRLVSLLRVSGNEKYGFNIENGDRRPILKNALQLRQCSHITILDIYNNIIL